MKIILEDFIYKIYQISNFSASSAFYENEGNAGYLEMLEDGKRNTASPLKKIIWLKFGKYAKKWKQFTQVYKVDFTIAALEQATEEINNAESFSEIKTLLKGYEIPITENTETAAQELKKVLLSKQVYEATKSVFRSSKFIEVEDYKTFQKTCNSLLQLLRESIHIINTESKHLSTEQIKRIEQTEDTPVIINYLEKSFDYLIENDQLLASFTTPERQLLTIALNQKNTLLSDQIEYNLLQHWITHIETRHPILRGVSTLKINQLEERLQTSIEKKRELCQAIILINLRENTYKNIERNRLGNATTYRELAHQVSKKRQLWSIRKTIENFSTELFALIPCWLASPETVSAIFPLKNDSFDLVIFDEASQCYVEHGLPAALRGKQVVIAGDSQQLQPSDLYQIRYDDEQGESAPLLEIDSLLDVASQVLPQTQLRGHYRSKSLDLISFSNQYFYNNKLTLLPDYQYINNKNPSIHYIKTNGIWEENKNEIEAQEVITILKKIDSKVSIGVVTFNYKQAELISNLIQEKLKIWENIRVKNIENIQGDEFDVVIFSIGYAPNKNGKLFMNFGTLNQQGGENRLNVAITRARSEIYVVASILPHELNVNNSLNNGPKVLQNYLQYALDVSEEKFVPTPHASTEYRSSKMLKNQLINQAKETDYQLVEELPFSDLTVIKNNKYESLILTDDGLYFDSPSSKDAHGYLPLLLKQKGWSFKRKWSRNAS